MLACDAATRSSWAGFPHCDAKVSSPNDDHVTLTARLGDVDVLLAHDLHLTRSAVLTATGVIGGEDVPQRHVIDHHLD